MKYTFAFLILGLVSHMSLAASVIKVETTPELPKLEDESAISDESYLDLGVDSIELEDEYAISKESDLEPPLYSLEIPVASSKSNIDQISEDVDQRISTPA